MLLRPHRSTRSRRLPLLAAGALLAAPLLAGCGMNYATDHVNTISAGINDQSGESDVAILGAVVIAQQDDAGLFAATLVNKNRETAVTVDGFALDGTAVQSDQGYTITKGGRVSLIHEGGVPVTGTFTAGDFVDVTVSFSSGQVTTVEIPVVTACHQYDPAKLTTLDFPASTEVVDTIEPDGEPGVYDCEPAEQVDHHAEGGEH